MTRASIAALFVVISLSTTAHAQEVGGYSAGAGNQGPRAFEGAASPSFTQDRDFTGARFWQLDPGRFTVEQWWTYELGRTAGTDDHLFQTEFEMGVAPHVQVDVYVNAEIAQDEHAKVLVADKTGVATEVRYAIPSRYGEIWGNPTLYLEALSQYYDSPRAEGRLLLGGELFDPRVVAALNLFYEQNVFKDARTGIDREMGVAVGASYAIVQGVFRVGAESRVGWDNHGTSTLYPVLWAGPSVLLTHPSKRIKLLATVYRGFEPQDPALVPVVIVGSSL